MNDIDKQIIDDAANGNMIAFKQIYDLHVNFVYRVAFRVARHEHDAQEITQDVFVILHQKLQTFNHASAFKTWLWRITTNTAINYVKKRPQTKGVVDYDGIEELAAQDFDGDGDISRQHQQVTDLFNQLNPDQRACLTLRLQENLSYQQIADVLQININTVRTRLKRAKEKLVLIYGKTVRKDI